MKFNISIPDSLFEKYVKNYGLPAAYNRMRQALELCQDIQVHDRAILVTGDDRRALEAVFETTIDDSTKLVKLVQNVTRVRLGNVDIGFSDDQLVRLDMQAKFHGRTTEQYIKETIEELKATMLERV